MPLSQLWITQVAALLILATVAGGGQALAAPQVGLIKASGSAVYYYAVNGKRYVFPNEKTYRTWYADFSGVQTVSDAELAAIPLAANVTYRPGARMIKLRTDPKVYAIDARGTLRWVTSESVAVALYGSNWSTMVDDLSDAFFVSYRIGTSISSTSDFSPSAAITLATTISADLGLTATTPPVVQKVTVEADDYGLYPASVAVLSGTLVQLTFTVRSANVYYGGLTFRSALFGDVTAPPGGTATVEFTPQTKMTYSFSAYWPSSNVLKATGSIVVQ